MRRSWAMRHRARDIATDEGGASARRGAWSALGGPKDIAGLHERVWGCDGYGVLHERGTNAAVKLSSGTERRPLIVETPALPGGGRR